MLSTLEEKFDPAWTALVVVDMQHDYIDQEGALGKAGLDLAPVRAIVDTVRQLVATAREAGVPVVFVRNWHSDATDSEAWLERSTRRHRGGPRAGQAGTWGAEWYPGLEPTPDDVVFHKSRYDAFLRTGLDDELRGRGIRSLVFTGTATNICVESSLRAAHMRDYYVAIVADGCASSDLELHDATLRNVERSFGTVVDAATISDVWSRSRTVVGTEA